MTRTADDLIALFDAIAGPDELEDGVGYRLALPPPRATTLAGARVLVLAQHPLSPTDEPVAAALEALADGLEKAGAQVSRESALLPDLDAATRIYMRMLAANIAARSCRKKSFAEAAAEAQGVDPANSSLAAERLRGVTLSFRGWPPTTHGARDVRASWRAFFREFDALICPISPTAAFPHDHEPDQERRRLIVNGAEQPYVDLLLFGRASRPCRACRRRRFPSGARPKGCRSASRSLDLGSKTARRWSSRG